MKRGTPEHPKTMQLAEAVQAYLREHGHDLHLDFCQTIALGLLERLAHFTARYAPAGDVGKYSNPRIALGIGWPFDATWLIETLTDPCKWLDVMSNGARLYVHDWHDHSDNAADKYLHDKGLTYANGMPTRRGKKSRPSPDNVATQSRLSEPKPESQSESEPQSEPKPKSKPKSEPESEANAGAESVDPNLRVWIEWWNDLAEKRLVLAGIRAGVPNKAVLRGWSRLQKDAGLRALLADREALRREIAASSFLRKSGWFTLPKLFGGCNQEGEVIAEKLLAGSYRDEKPARLNDPRGNKAAYQKFVEDLGGDDGE